ncbi:phage repressor protein CI [Pantoea vagans]|uniref:phage repressor protein CI n=1 Tax=Pantoea vagans TaxID=470934 RepID=UPI003015D70A
MSIKENTKRHESSLIRKSIESNKGGKDVIFRIVEAYGFSSRQALCNHLGVSQSTLANRSARDTFPADWVIICHVETGASLTWLTTGKGLPFLDAPNSRTVIVEHKKISNGVLEVIGDYILDGEHLLKSINAPFVVDADRSTYLIESYGGDAVDGMWLIEIDKIVSIREIVRFPGGLVRVENGKASFECQAADIKVLGKVISATEYL